MARINLLPWRQAERERKNREFMTIIIGTLLLSLLAAGAAWSYFNNELESQHLANDKIKAENVKLDKALTEIDSLEKQRDDMLARMKVIQDLQGRRPIPVRVWDDIAKLIPAQMYLTNMKREADVITFTGRADNPNVVSTFIRNLDGSQWLEGSAVKSIQQSQNTAYQNPTAPTPVTAATPGGTAPAPRPTYPEDNYVQFVVTTKIKQSQDASSATGSTAAPNLKTNGNAASSAVGSTTPTSSPSTTTSSTSNTAVHSAAATSAVTTSPANSVAPNTTSNNGVNNTVGNNSNNNSANATANNTKPNLSNAPINPAARGNADTNNEALQPISNTATVNTTAPVANPSTATGAATRGAQ